MLIKYTHVRKSEFWRKLLLMSPVEKKLKTLWWTGCEFYPNCKSSRENFHTYDTGWEERNCDELGVTFLSDLQTSGEKLLTYEISWKDIAVFSWVWTFILCGNIIWWSIVSTISTACPLYSKWNRRLSNNDLKGNNKLIFLWKCRNSNQWMENVWVLGMEIKSTQASLTMSNRQQKNEFHVNM